MSTVNKRRGERAFERFNIHQRIQHIMMFTSFIVLAITGLAIKYNESTYAVLLVNIFGGFDAMYRAHLVGAVVMLASCAYHLLYLLVYAVWRREISTAVFPKPQDVKDLFQNLSYHLGLTNQRPEFDRYSYKEKFDYWAVFWGIFIMGGSGLMIWFPGIATRYFPRWLIDSAREAHAEEAMLAILAIFIWHMYNVHFNPRFFPMSRVWLDGKISEELMEEEHPKELRRLLRQKGELPDEG